MTICGKCGRPQAEGYSCAICDEQDCIAVDDYLTKDSGDRRVFSTGSQRDVRTGKGRYDLLPRIAIDRLAKLYERGAVKYDDNNWKRGQPLSVYIDSMLRHAFQVADGVTDEDHAAAVMWNAAAYMWTRQAIEDGRLPDELDDLGHCKGGK